MFRRVLIANRGEIAVRIAATLQQMGIRALAVYSEPDRRSLHVARADEAYPLEGKTAAETYLCRDKLLEIAANHRADAIHPGYGFLSENPDFAQACVDAGITFIGPPASVMRKFGDKIEAKRMFAQAGVPVVPGWSGEGDDDPNRVASEARIIGYPVLVKAAAGGGGKGMRVAREERELTAAWEAGQREAKSAFGDSRVFLEKYIERPRHVEFQIFADTHGNVVHMFERECSIQRRHQKIVEESPSPALTPELREKMGEAAVRAAGAAGYVNAGTAEFIVDEQGSFYFLEVNARLQVEHPVTEVITHRDLVADQIRAAAGEPLPFRQQDLSQHGHAMECRIYAEDAAREFVPSTGTIERYMPPFGPNIRVDGGVVEGGEVSVYYDPMLAKLIVWGASRDESLERMAWALRRFVILGVTTNIGFLQELIGHPEFRAGRLHTHFLTQHRIEERVDASLLEEARMAAALAAMDHESSSTASPTSDGRRSVERLGPWKSAGRWRALS